MRASSILPALLAAILAGGVTNLVMTSRLKDRDRQLADLASDNLRLKDREAKLRSRVHPRPEAKERAGNDLSEEAGEAHGGGVTLHFQNDGPIERVVRLWLYLDDHPNLSIPDLRLLSDDEWLRVAADFPLDSEESERRALSRLRSYATQRSGSVVIAALNSYMASHQGQAPGDVSELAPFLSNPQDADLLGSFVRYTGEGPKPTMGVGSVLQVRRLDGQFDPWIVYGRNGAFEVHSPPTVSP